MAMRIKSLTVAYAGVAVQAGHLSPRLQSVARVRDHSPEGRGPNTQLINAMPPVVSPAAWSYYPQSQEARSEASI
jgi:hypothetical protein